MKNSVILILVSIMLSLSVFAQDEIVQPDQALLGYWEGVFIRNNSHQKIDIRFFKTGDKLFSFQNMEEWYPAFGEFEIPVETDEKGNVSFNTGLGKALIKLDKDNLEIIGQIQDSNPTIYLHLKKVPGPPSGLYKTEPVLIKNGSVILSGHLHGSTQISEKTAVIVVGGRGCNPAKTESDLMAKTLRRYGVNVLVYQKRGTGKSTGDCSKATISDLASDTAAIKKFLENHPRGFERIGLIGSSAGGWVIARASEIEDFDFMISIVGPSTSVREQQYQSMYYGAEVFKLSKPALKNLEEYTDLVFDAPADQKSFDRFGELLALAKKENWLGLLDETDKPKSIEGINNLWVRRHNYDPGKALSNLNKPFLAIYGQKDWIVPPKENIERLEKLFGGERKSLIRIVVARGAEHGMEKEAKYVTLPKNNSYWHFYRISPQVPIEIIGFLREHQFIEN